jgi:hypothetical protein
MEEFREVIVIADVANIVNVLRDMCIKDDADFDPRDVDTCLVWHENPRRETPSKENVIEEIENIILAFESILEEADKDGMGDFADDGHKDYVISVLEIAAHNDFVNRLEVYEELSKEYNMTKERTLSVSSMGWNIANPLLQATMDVGEAFVVDVPFSPANDDHEPSTLAIFALGLMGLGLRRFKK